MRHLMLIISVAAFVLGTAPANADLGDQLAKLLADDGAAGDQFGYSVAMGGATAIVGAHRDEDNGTNSGSAYLFDATTGRQLFKLLPNDGSQGAHFGWSVAISGSTAIVGAVFDNVFGAYSGSAYLFDTTTGRQLFKLVPNDGVFADYFGWSVGVSGNVAIVGTPFENDNGAEAGAAYLFNITTGQQIAKLLADDGTLFDNFGFSVAISGPPGSEIAIIGVHLDDDNGLSSGSAYLFDATTGEQIAKLLPDDGEAFDHFGHSVAINGVIAIVGANGDSGNGTNSGSAYLFDTTTGRQIAKLLPDDGAAGDWFGRSVAISGAPGKKLAIVGAYGDDDNDFGSGSAYLFDITTGRQIGKLLSNDGATGDEFGRAVGIGGPPGKEVALVGAWRDDDNGFDTGSAYLFDAAGPEECPWDLDDNAVVGTSDLLSLLASWGSCKGCPGDFDGDGIVGVADLLALLANWGPCPSMLSSAGHIGRIVNGRSSARRGLRFYLTLRPRWATLIATDL